MTKTHARPIAAAGAYAYTRPSPAPTVTHVPWILATSSQVARSHHWTVTTAIRARRTRAMDRVDAQNSRWIATTATHVRSMAVSEVCAATIPWHATMEMPAQLICAIRQPDARRRLRTVMMATSVRMIRAIRVRVVGANR